MPSAGRTEIRDVDMRRVALFGGALACFILLTLVVLALIYGIPPQPLSFGSDTGLFQRDVPVLQSDPHGDLQAYRVEKDRLLHGYGWADRSAGIARIPIEEAMKIVAGRGVPDWGQPTHVTSDQCAFLAETVPRVPAAQNCSRSGAQEKR